MAASVQAAKLVAAVEAAVAQDVGGRGIAHLFQQGDLAVAGSNFLAATGVLLFTGFPCVQSTPPTENDGARNANETQSNPA